MDKLLYFLGTSVKAALTQGQLTLTAVSAGSAGNYISLIITEDGTESTSTVSVSGNAISVAIGTNDDQTAEDIRDAIIAFAGASALVLATSSGTTPISAAVAEVFLTGGLDNSLTTQAEDLVAVVTASGAVTLHFDVASSEPSVGIIGAKAVLTCLAASEKALLDQLYGEINSGRASLIDVAALSKCTGITHAEYEINPAA